MKQLQELINKTWYGSVGYVANPDDLKTLEKYIKTNLEVLEEFEGVVIATNYGSKEEDALGISLRSDHTKLWEKYLPNVIIIDSPLNRGHNFGTADLDNLLVRFCKENAIQWLCKTSTDIILRPEVLEIMVEDADFYYTDGFHYENLVEWRYDYSLMYGEYFFPQTNFYIININSIDYLYDDDYLNETYAYSLTIPDYNGKIWEYLPDWACENFLKSCVKRNKLVKHNLVDLEKYTKLCNVIEKYKIGDPSHKNLMIKGICHFQFPQQQILEI